MSDAELVVCPFCGELADRVPGDAIYPHRRDLYHKTFWRCAPCDAYVGCHGDTDVPMGTLADAETRQARREAHVYFDSFWRLQDISRSGAYQWLREAMDLPADECHIGKFNAEACRRVVFLVKEHPQFNGLI